MDRPRFNRQQAVKQLKESVQTGHRTGLTRDVLHLFEAAPPLDTGTVIAKKPPKLPYTGVAQYTTLFASPGDTEYEPPPKQDLPEVRKVRNREFSTQARIETETKLEK